MKLNLLSQIISELNKNGNATVIIPYNNINQLAITIEKNGRFGEISISETLLPLDDPNTYKRIYKDARVMSYIRLIVKYAFSEESENNIQCTANCFNTPEAYLKTKTPESNKMIINRVFRMFKNTLRIDTVKQLLDNPAYTILTESTEKLPHYTFQEIKEFYSYDEIITTLEEAYKKINSELNNKVIDISPKNRQIKQNAAFIWEDAILGENIISILEKNLSELKQEMIIFSAYKNAQNNNTLVKIENIINAISNYDLINDNIKETIINEIKLLDEPIREKTKIITLKYEAPNDASNNQN